MEHLIVRGPYSNNTSPPLTGTRSDRIQPPSRWDFSYIVTLEHLEFRDRWKADVRPVMPPPMTAAWKARCWNRKAVTSRRCLALRPLEVNNPISTDSREVMRWSVEPLCLHLVRGSSDVLLRGPYRLIGLIGLNLTYMDAIHP